MKTFIILLLFMFIFISCNKEPEPELTKEEAFVPGDLSIGFKENASLTTAFDLVNNFQQLEIEFVFGPHFISDLPNDSIDYVVSILKTKAYLNDERWTIVKNGNVYNHYSTGKITVVCPMLNLDKANQQDWYQTASLLKLAEQLSIKVFYLKVPIGMEIYWRDRFRKQNIVKWAELNYYANINPWP